MPKNIVQDVVPGNSRRSIRDITLPGHRKISRIEQEEVVLKNDSEEGESDTKELHYSHKSEDSISWKSGNPRFFSKWGIWIIGLVSLCFLMYVIGNFFFGATVNLTAKTFKAELASSFTAKPSAVNGELAYHPIFLSEEQEIVIPADGEKLVESRSSGKIIIYNNYSTATQRLVKNTRFETPDGLIYKINDSVVVPGRKIEGGKTVPGSIEVTVYAESAGQEYNIGLTDFTIPGFKTNPERYSNFYARSKTVMSGGRIGKEKTITDAKLSKFKGQLEKELQDKLISKIKTTIPGDEIFYEGAYRVKFDLVSSTSNVVKNTVTLKVKGEIMVFSFNRSLLGQTIGESVIDKLGDSRVEVSNLSELSFKLSDKSKVDLTTSGPIQFTLNGSANIVWKIDTVKIAEKLIGKHKSELSSVVGPDPAITKAEAIIRPFWKNIFPKKVAKIKVNII